MVLFLSQSIDSKLSLLARQHTTNGTATAPHVYGDHPAYTHTLTTLFTFPTLLLPDTLVYYSMKPDQSVSSIRKPSHILYDELLVEIRWSQSYCHRPTDLGWIWRQETIFVPASVVFNMLSWTIILDLQVFLFGCFKSFLCVWSDFLNTLWIWSG